MRDAASGGSRAPGGGDEAGAAMTNSAELPAAALAAGSGGGVGGGAGGGGAGVGTGATPLRQWGDDLSPTSAQYLPTIALRELLAILHDASLSAYHHRLIAAIVYIFTALGDTCAPLLPRVMPTLLAILLAGDTSMRASTDGVAGGNAPSSVGATGGMPVVGVTSLSRPATTHVFNHLMQQLPVLVSAMHAHLQPWVPQLVELVRMHWHGPLLLQVITLLEQLTLLLREDLAPYASELIPSLGAVIDADTTAQRVPSLAALGALDGFGPLLREYTALLLPTILRLLEQVRSSSPPCAPRIAC
jgi:FKBP12-rapamycin complex-associated protein